jgi:hypothetical protein
MIETVVNVLSKGGIMRPYEKWELKEYDDAWDVQRDNGLKKIVTIARVFKNNDADHDFTAKLIKAAPSLLEACETVLSILSKDSSYEPINTLRAQLAKAVMEVKGK